MPLKLNISLSRKVGEANYGSRGATVGLELEAEGSLIHNPDEFYDQVAHLFTLARESADRELARPPAAVNNNAVRQRSTAEPSRHERIATPNQLRALMAIARRQEVDLASELRERFGLEGIGQLSLRQASELIDALKAMASDHESDEHETPRVAQVS
jgi:hypothetical protein